MAYVERKIVSLQIKLTIYSVIAPFDAFENIIENQAFAPLK